MNVPPVAELNSCAPPRRPHVFATEPDGVDRCGFCGIKWVDWTRGVASGTAGFTTKSRKTRQLQSLSG